MFAFLVLLLALSGGASGLFYNREAPRHEILKSVAEVTIETKRCIVPDPIVPIHDPLWDRVAPVALTQFRTYNKSDALSKFVAHNFGVVMLIKLKGGGIEDALTKAIRALASLHTSPQLRSARRLIAVDKEGLGEEDKKTGGKLLREWRRETEEIVDHPAEAGGPAEGRTKVPLITDPRYTSLLRRLGLMNVVGLVAVDLSGGVTEGIQKLLPRFGKAVSSILVVPPWEPLRFRLEPYSYLLAKKADKDGFKAAVKPGLVGLGSLDKFEHPFIMDKSFPEGKVLTVHQPTKDEYPKVRPIRIWPKWLKPYFPPASTSWFHTPQTLLLSLSDRCKKTIFTNGMCVRNIKEGPLQANFTEHPGDKFPEGNPTFIPSSSEEEVVASLKDPAVRDKYMWGCDQVHPLAYRAPEAYMNYKDPVALEMKKKLTIVITSHLSPSAPSTLLLRTLMQSMHFSPEMRLCKVIILTDGLSEGTSAKKQQRFKDMIRNINLLKKHHPLFEHIELVVMPSHGHLKVQMQAVEKHISTPWVFVLQPDLPFANRPDVYNSIQTMEMNDKVKHIRFHSRPNIRTPFDRILDTRVAYSNRTFLPLLRVIGWSSQNHIVSSDYYRKYVFPHTPSGDHTMENQVNAGPLGHNKGSRELQKLQVQFGTYVYGYGQDRPYITHVDGSERHFHIPEKYKQAF